MFAVVARITAVLALITLGIGASFRVKVLPVELPMSVDELQTHIRHEGAAIDASITLDWFFIAAYTSMFLGYARLHRLRGATSIAAITGTLAIGTALFDVLENLAIRAALKGDPGTPYVVSSIKWLLFFLVLGSCAPLFRGTSHTWITAIAVAFALAGILGVLVCITLAFTPEFRDCVTCALSVAFLPMLAATLLFLIKPRLLAPSS